MQKLSNDVREAVVAHIIRFNLLRLKEFRERFLSIPVYAQVLERAGRRKQSVWDVIFALSESYLSGRELITSDIYLLTDMSRTTSGRCINILAEFGIISLTNDVTDRRRTIVTLDRTYCQALDGYVGECFLEFEDLFRHSEERFLKIFQASPALQSITRINDGGIVDVNEAWLNTLGFKRAEVLGKTVFEIGILVDSTLENRRNIIGVTEKNKGGAPLVTQLRCKNGGIRDVIYSGEVINFAGEDHLLMISQDITEQKRAEESKNKFLDALESVPVGIILWDADGRFVMCNEQFRNMDDDSADDWEPGSSFEDFIRKRAYSGNVLSALGREEEWIAERIARRSNKVFNAYDTQVGDRWFRIRETELFDGSVMTLLTDVSEQIEAQEALAKSESKF